MSNALNPNHVANLVAKTIRWADALEASDIFESGALAVPAVLIALECMGTLGAHLADAAWVELATKVSTHTGRTETAPESTRQAIANECTRRQRQSEVTFTPVDPFAGLPQ